MALSLISHSVTLLCDEAALTSISSKVTSGTEKYFRASKAEDYETEHLALTISVKSVPSLQAAIQHINSQSSHHTDAIVTESEVNASIFCRGVDSAGTFVNASTRFADGFRYGFGTEVGISTGRIHARGPVGLEGLVTYKYILRSQDEKGHIVGDFGTGVGKKSFKHRPLKVDSLPF